MRLTISQKVAVGFGLGLLLLIVINIASYRFITDFSASAELRKRAKEA